MKQKDCLENNIESYLELNIVSGDLVFNKNLLANWEEDEVYADLNIKYKKEYFSRYKISNYKGKLSIEKRNNDIFLKYNDCIICSENDFIFPKIFFESEMIKNILMKEGSFLKEASFELKLKNLRTELLLLLRYIAIDPVQYKLWITNGTFFEDFFHNHKNAYLSLRHSHVYFCWENLEYILPFKLQFVKDYLNKYHIDKYCGLFSFDRNSDGVVSLLYGKEILTSSNANRSGDQYPEKSILKMLMKDHLNILSRLSKSCCEKDFRTEYFEFCRYFLSHHESIPKMMGVYDR